ncbi:MAG: polyphosphate polymerase domain-containing protein [Treponema sp.]|uniref:polyphosphate polymerase domain-containing protein n=1 Tax=Treponema sp. TaxID=166 RepID=UPI0025FC4E9D|nr:polyphosphate polymerase domain-containing protein [Treponema sp.]MBQ9281256.1 polyphosphate polymerase domain-containing protein [Treponema sp.]MBR1721536.1 polyphosphate polymerase domain-containing protein [Treponema sp.]
MKNDKWRHEFKYLSPEYILKELELRLGSLMLHDKHTGQGGSYAIRSIYFDDIYNTCYFENESGTDPREKFRIRIYNCSSERISLELKQREKGKCHKISTPISKETCEEIMAGKIPKVQNEYPFLLKKLIAQMLCRGLKPVCIVAYERVPLIWEEGNVRVTFDRNIRSSNDIRHFFDKEIAFRPILGLNTNMIEVKFDEFLPDFINEVLQTGRLSQTSFSKYYLCRKYNLAAETL